MVGGGGISRLPTEFLRSRVLTSLSQPLIFALLFLKLGLYSCHSQAPLWDLLGLIHSPSVSRVLALPALLLLSAVLDATGHIAGANTRIWNRCSFPGPWHPHQYPLFLRIPRLFSAKSSITGPPRGMHSPKQLITTMALGMLHTLGPPSKPTK